jgi:outer membrane protein TolC
MSLALIVVTTMLAALPAYSENVSGAANLEKLTLVAMSNSPAIHQAEAGLQKAKANLDQYKSGYFPMAGLSAVYSRQAPNSEISFPGFGSFKFFPDNNVDCHVDLSQQIYDFGRSHAQVSGGKWEVKAAEYSLDMARQQVRFQTLQLFYGILLYEQEIKLQADEIQALTQYCDMTKNKVTTGVATNFDVMTIQVRLSEVQTAHQDLENELRKLRIDLAKTIGIDNYDSLTPTGAFVPTPAKADEKAMVSFGLDNSRELAIADAMVNQCRERLKSEKCRYYPVITAAVGAGVKTGYFPDMDKLQPNATGEITADMPIFSFGRLASVKAAEADLKSAVESCRQTRERIIADIRRAVSDLNTSCDKIEAARLHVALAEKTVEQANVRYSGGMITGLDLLSVRADLSKANVGYVRSLYDCLVSDAVLKRAAGMSQIENAGK